MAASTTQDGGGPYVRFLLDHVTPEARRTFCTERLRLSEVASALAERARTAITAALQRKRELLARVTVLELRALAEATWRDVVAAEPGLTRNAELGVDALTDTLRATAATDVEARTQLVLEAVTSAIHAAIAALGPGAAALASATTLLRAGATQLQQWEEYNLRRVNPSLGSSSSSSGGSSGSDVYKCPLDAPAATLEKVAGRLASNSGRLAVADLRALAEQLQTKSITAAMCFAAHVHADTWRSLFLAVPARSVVGVPARLREARPATAPVQAMPRVLPPAPPSAYLYTVGRGQEPGAHLGFRGESLLPGGGLLVTLPNWTGHFLRVEPETGIASVIHVASPGGEWKATIKLRFLVDAPPARPDGTLVEDDDADAEDANASADADATRVETRRATIDWIDAQRDAENNLVLAWGGRHPITGGPLWSYHRGLHQQTAFTRDNAFAEVDEADVDAMYEERFELGGDVDWRNHGNLLAAETTFELRESGGGVGSSRDIVPTTRIVYHEHIVDTLRQTEAVAVWGCARHFVVWTRRGGTLVVGVSDDGKAASLGTGTAPTPSCVTAIAPLVW